MAAGRPRNSHRSPLPTLATAGSPEEAPPPLTMPSSCTEFVGAAVAAVADVVDVVDTTAATSQNLTCRSPHVTKVLPHGVKAAAKTR